VGERAHRAIPGERRLERFGIAQHREVFLYRCLGDVTLPELASQPSTAVLEETGGGGRIVEGLVMARALLLIVHVLVEGTAEGSRMRAREDGERGETLGMTKGRDPRDLPAPVVPDEMERPRGVTARCRQMERVGKEPVDAVGSEP